MSARTLFATLCLFVATLGTAHAAPHHTAAKATRAPAATVMEGASNVAALTGDADQPVLTTRLVASEVKATAGQTINVAWEFTLAPHWHIYWSNAGDSGLPPALTPLQPQGAKALPLMFPTPQVISIPPITNYGYQDSVTLTAPFTIPQSAAMGPNVFAFKATFLYCNEVCMPGRAEFQLPVTVAKRAKGNDAFKPAANMPTALSGSAAPTAEVTGRTVQLNLPVNLSDPAVHFIPFTDGVIDDSAPQTLTGTTLAVHLDPRTTATPTSLSGLLLLGGQGYSFTTPLQATLPVAEQPQPAQEEETPADTSLNLFGAVLFALLAGLILNLMPCVLPVLSLKLLGLVKHHHGANRTQHTLAYAGGILATFWLFAAIVAGLRATGANLGWGFHLQNPTLVAGLMFLMVAIAFNFFGLYEAGTLLTRLGAKPKGPNAQELTATFATGALAVIVATPCTVPFMGGAMAYALTQPLMPSLVVFSALGLGMAAPFLLSIPYPAVFRWLPKAGPWMSTFRHALGWPMLATALWLAYVFTTQTGQAGLFILLALLLAFVFTLWLMGARPHPTTKALPWLLLLLSLLALHRMATPSTSAIAWQTWSPTAVEEALKKGPVFVDFTADWCITCKVTEATVLNTQTVQALFTRTGTTLFRGDWTNQNPAITEELARHNRRGVPLYLLYTKAGQPPEVLPQLLTLGLLKQKLETH